jgi:hypothetical protein
VLMSVVPGSTCWQMRGQVLNSFWHQFSVKTLADHIFLFRIVRRLVSHILLKLRGTLSGTT